MENLGNIEKNFNQLILSDDFASAVYSLEGKHKIMMYRQLKQQYRITASDNLPDKIDKTLKIYSNKKPLS